MSGNVTSMPRFKTQAQRLLVYWEHSKNYHRGGLQVGLARDLQLIMAMEFLGARRGYTRLGRAAANLLSKAERAA